MTLSSVGMLPQARCHFDGPRPTLRAGKLKYLGDLTKKSFGARAPRQRSVEAALAGRQRENPAGTQGAPRLSAGAADYRFEAA